MELHGKDTLSRASTLSYILGIVFISTMHREDTFTTKKYRGVHFGKYKSHRTKFKGRDGPGPGDYYPFSGVPNGSKQASESQGAQASPGYLPRYHELVTHMEQKKAVPGPGQYEIKSQFEKKSSDEDDQDTDHPSKVPFGSRLERFLTPKHASPACTTYEDPRTSLETTKRLSGLGKAPFGQTSARFRENRQAKILPGPGTYNDSQVTSLATELTKKAMLQGIQKHPFSSTSVRTAPLVKRDELDMPGPAHYQKDSEEADGSNPDEHYNRPPKHSHMFSSTTGRLYTPPKIVTDIPPPGSYEVSNSYTKSQGKAEPSYSGTSQSVFLSSAERFAPPRDILLEEPDALNPGPGEYESPAFMGKIKTGMICSKEGRFKPIKSLVPGPGAYAMSKSQRDTLLQGTFNATLDNPLGEDQTAAQKASAGKKRTAFVIGV